MKVFINKLEGGYCGGMIIAAADSAEQAYRAYYEWLKAMDYYEIWDCDEGREVTFEEFCGRYHDRYTYQPNTWEELKGVTYDGDTPKVLAEENYIE